MQHVVTEASGSSVFAPVRSFTTARQGEGDGIITRYYHPVGGRAGVQFGVRICSISMPYCAMIYSTGATEMFSKLQSDCEFID